MRPSRRAFTGGLATVAVSLVAGCVGGGSEQTETAEGTPNPRLQVGDRALSSAFPIELVEPDAGEIEGHARGDARIGSVHWHENERHTHWHFGPLEVPRDGEREVRVRFVDSDLEAIPLGDGEPFGADVFLAAADPEGFLSIEQAGGRITLAGEAVGEGRLGFELRYDGDVAWEAPELQTAVVAESDG
jgi:hypothetical protein